MIAENRILIDSSAWIEALREKGDPLIRNQVSQFLLSGQGCWCEMIRLELWNGAKGPSERKYLKSLEKEIECIQTTAAVWEQAFQMAQHARNAGLTIPSTDLLIAAVVRYYGIGLLHKDSHYELLSKNKLL